METSQFNKSKRHFICTTSVCNGDNNELIFRRSYQGDWGDWDDKIENPVTEFTSEEPNVCDPKEDILN
ncbi:MULTISPECIES: hypothetical protein [Flavobacterium]|uniref:hypothetical protein n=1 Tax=Flavobacterium TaxID=237 RepID=UPI001183685D|nr:MULTISPECIES: hypothetical protein [Flavobacterium]MCR4029785.1 hypothetical protein [Flavobacterium panacis]